MVVPRPIRLVLAGFALPMVLLTACSGAGAPSVASPPAPDAIAHTAPRTMAEGKGSGKADGEFPRTVAHFQGETTIQQAPQRVAVISTGQLDALLTLGVTPVGATSPSGADVVPQYLLDAHPDREDALRQMAYLGSRTEPSVESVAAAEPDLIVVNSAGKNAEALYATLSRIAPTVVTQGTGVNWKPDFLLLADAVGRTQAAQAWLDAYHDDARTFGETVTGRPTISLLRRSGDRIRVFGIASFAGSVAEDSALARPESQSFTDETSRDISVEQLDQADGTWIFYGVEGGDETRLTSLALWPTLTAVEARRAVEVADEPFYLNAGPTAARLVLDTLQTSLAG